jgi:hypothetical protein
MYDYSQLLKKAMASSVSSQESYEQAYNNHHNISQNFQQNSDIFNDKTHMSTDQSSTVCNMPSNYSYFETLPELSVVNNFHNQQHCLVSTKNFAVNHKINYETSYECQTDIGLDIHTLNKTMSENLQRADSSISESTQFQHSSASATRRSSIIDPNSENYGQNGGIRLEDFTVIKVEKRYSNVCLSPE